MARWVHAWLCHASEIRTGVVEQVFSNQTPSFRSHAVDEERRRFVSDIAVVGVSDLSFFPHLDTIG